MTDIVARLRKTEEEWPFTADGTDGWIPLCREAATHIEELATRIRGLEAILSNAEKRITQLEVTLDTTFDLLILARNSKDEEALQDAINLVAIAASREKGVPANSSKTQP